MADPFSMLEADHRQVEELLSALADTDPGAEREELVEQLTKALQLHMRFEETSIYPLALKELDAELTEEAEIEHRLARDGLQKMNELVSAPGFSAAVAMVEGGIGHHVEEEESEMFPDLREQVDEEQQERLARDLIEAKRDAGLLEATLDRASKDDLFDIARALGLPAKSSLSKVKLRELVAASAP